MTVPRPIEAADISWVHALNELHAVELSPLSRARLVELVGRAAYAKAVDEEAAFLLAFDQGADYDSPNFLWFRDLFPRFLYVDRIAVSGRHRGRGLARRLYQDLFRSAAALEHSLVVCEVNADPPNPASDAFHEALGFTVVGEARLEDRAKSVRYLKRELSSNPSQELTGDR